MGVGGGGGDLSGPEQLWNLCVSVESPWKNLEILKQMGFTQS